MLTVCASSTDTSLTTTAYVKALLGTTSTANDATLSAHIAAASRWAERYLGYSLTVQSYAETVAGHGRRELMLARTPVRAVPRVYTGTDTGTATQVLSSEFALDREAGFLERKLGWEWRVPLFPGGLDDFPQAGQELREQLVDYVAGWTHGGIDTGSPHWSTEKGTTSTGRTLPEDIEHAVALRAVELFEGREDVTKEKLGDVEVNYSSAGVDRVGNPVPTPAERILNNYARVV